jgi:hypothetical protein
MSPVIFIIGMEIMIQEILQDVAEYFEVKLPAYRISTGQAGNYRPKRRLITIPKNDEGVYRKYVTVHEMAHHVDHSINTDRKGRTWHDEHFFLILVDIVTLVYDKVSDYPWYKEYRGIYARACRRGFSKRGLNRSGQPAKRIPLATMIRSMNTAGDKITTTPGWKP